MLEVLSQPIIAIVIFLGVLIFVHELGHFLVGKALGLGVEVFSIGFGPTIFTFRHKHTQYQLACIPLGGFVKFAGALPGEDVASPFKGQEFYKATWWRRLLTLAAGPGANLLFAVVTYSFLATAGIEYLPPIVGSVQPGSPSEKADLLPKDKIISIGNQKIKTWDDMQSLIVKSPSHKLNLQVKRGQQVLSKTITPSAVNSEDMFGRKVVIGRIGVIPGNIPAKVFSTSSQIMTGDRVTAVKFSRHTTLKTYEVATWYDLLTALAMAYNDNSSEVTLSVINSTLVASVDQLYEVTLPVSKAWSELGISKKHGLNLIVREKLANSIGLYDAQLVIAKAKKPSLALKVHDRIVAVNNHEIKSIFDYHTFFTSYQRSQATITVQRYSGRYNLDVKLKPLVLQKAAGKKTIYIPDVEFMGVLSSPKMQKVYYSTLWSALGYGLETTAKYSLLIVEGLWGLITGSVPLQSLGGPVMIANVAGRAVQSGLETFAKAMAIISINLGIVNLFPIPVLDGGHIVLVLVEVVRRRRLSPIAIENFQKVGFVLILSLVVLATYNDFSRFWSDILGGIVGFFDSGIPSKG